MEEHREFDYAVESYTVFNSGTYDKARHVALVRSVVVQGQRLLTALGAGPVVYSSTPGTPPNGSLEEAALWALNYFEHSDTANAQMHCAPVKYSPLTFRLAMALHDAWPQIETVTDEMARVLQHVGAYQPDPGR